MADEPIDIAKWFTDQPEPPGHTYELALVLGGTVSAGCYTAGIFDFLLEALDTWTAAKDRSDPRAPHSERHPDNCRNTAMEPRSLAWELKPRVSDDRLAARNAG